MTKILSRSKGNTDNSKEKGQALFEFVIFLPIILVLLSFMVSIGNSINASINQQKALRGYFYYLLKGNSRAPISSDLEGWNFQNAGMYVLGWQEDSKSRNPIASCFKLSSFFGDLNPGETCESPNVSEGITQFVRVYTVYGVCAENYQQLTGGAYLPVRSGIRTGSCQNKE